MSILIKIHELPGGVHPPEHKAQSLQLPLGKLPLPPVLILPLNQHIGAPAKPVVAVGERVLKGQLVAEADGIFSAHIHAPSSGQVTAIEDRLLPHPSGMSGTCIVITPDGQDEWVPLEPCPDYTQLDHASLVGKIRAAGITGLGGAGFPTAVKLNPRSNYQIDTLIINGTECEPYITADDVLMQTRADEVIAGTLLLAHILNQPAQLVIGIEDNKPAAIAALRKAAEGTRIQVADFPTKYPSGGEKQLIYILTGREVPHGQIPASIGIVCQNAGTTVAAWRAVRYGEPLISRITTVVGEALKSQRNIEVLIGTPIDYILEQHGFDTQRASRLVMGGPMMGFALPDSQVPVIKSTNCILAPTKQELPPPLPAQACIRCGMCAEACPVSLMPQQLFWYAQAEDQEKLQAHNLFDCIECGACSYVCPSNIPLVQYYRAAKGNIRQHLAEKEKSDRSRRRFEFRKERIAQEEAEKEAKRLARKQAAEEARQKLAEKAAAPGSAVLAEGAAPVSAEAVAPLLAEAAAKAQAAQPSPAEQQAKLERMLAAAQNGVDHARQPLVPKDASVPITAEQLEKQQARIKQAELKLSEAEKKLAEFVASQGATSAASAAIEKAKAKAAAQATMSEDEKRAEQLKSLEARLDKARERLAKAESENDANIDAFRAGVTKLEEKLKELTAPVE